MLERAASPSEHQAFIASQVTQITEEQIVRHLEALVGVRHPVTAPEALRASGLYLSEQMKSFGLDLLEEEIEGERNERFVNLIGRMSDGRVDKKILVIGAHYDTTSESPGADDNASGLAALLEVARLLAPLRGKMTVQFVAFSLEEEGFLGSDHYARQVRRNKVPLWGAIILECVGYTDGRVGSQTVPPGLPMKLPDRGDFIGLVGNAPAEPIQKAFEVAVSTYCPELPCISFLVPGKGEAIPDTRRSDHVPFWDRGYRAVMLTDTADFRNPHYHKKSDQLKTLDIPFITRVARSLAATAIELAELKQVSE
ncbi:MAG: M28 family peptidase [Nitrospirae bacterium]|nr:M28 family peptidase [Candidatus Manganitrophaceae bacterium]